jgi:hypothetical protein
VLYVLSDLTKSWRLVVKLSVGTRGLGVLSTVSSTETEEEKEVEGKAELTAACSDETCLEATEAVVKTEEGVSSASIVLDIVPA